VASATVVARPVDGQLTFGSNATTPTGQYTIEGLAAGAYSVTVRGSREQSRVYIGRQDSVLDIELRGLSVAGVVFDGSTGLPLAGADVALTSWPVTRDAARWGAATNHEGKFSIEGIEAGDYELSVYKPDYDLVRQRETVSASVFGFTLTLPRNDGLEIRVHDADTGTPLPMVAVRVQDRGPGLRLPLSDGVGELPDALAGETVEISANGYAPVSITPRRGGRTEVTLAPRQSP
jgi:hypothetical protein